VPPLRPSILDHRTLATNPHLPLEFLRGCGLPDFIIDNRHVLHGDPLQFQSCFISYSNNDTAFAERLHNDLQGKGIRTWYAPEDLKGGEYLHDQINRAIQVHDRVLLVLSETSIEREWVKLEIRKALQREQREDRRVLFPIRLVGMERIREREWIGGTLGKDLIEEICKYFIPNFSAWESDHETYQKAFHGLVSDLRATGPTTGGNSG